MEPPLGGDEARDDVGELVRVFVGGIDQHQAAPLLRGEQGAERLPAVALMDGHLRIAGEQPAQLGHIVRVKFAAGQAVVGPPHGADQHGGAGIETERVDEAQIAGQRRRRSVEQAADALAPLAGALGGVSLQVVAPGAGMGVQHEDRRRLGLEKNRISQTSSACFTQSAKLPEWKAWR